MEFIDAFPLYIFFEELSDNRQQIEEVGDPSALYSTLMQLIVRLASQGLIHGDFNEFNILVREDGQPVLIDFPQMISIDHPNAPEYFERDVECIRTFFLKKFQFESADVPKWENVKREGNLDFDVKASGYGGKLLQEMEMFHREISVVTDNHRNGRTAVEDVELDDDDEGSRTDEFEFSEDETEE